MTTFFHAALARAAAQAAGKSNSHFALAREIAATEDSLRMGATDAFSQGEAGMAFSLGAKKLHRLRTANKQDGHKARAALHKRHTDQMNQDYMDGYHALRDAGSIKIPS